MASTFEEEVSDSDDDMITCHVCMMRFNTTERKPKFLDCHHYFCVDCIRGFSKVNPVPCPTCRGLTNISGRKIEDLTTNNIVLRLVTIATGRARELAERGKKRKIGSVLEEKQQEWCTDCSFFAYGGCYKDKHHIQNYNNFYQDHVFLLKSVMDDVQSSCNQALSDFKKIQFVHQSISHKLKLLNHEITSREAYSNATIAELEDYLKSVKDVDISQQDDGVINKISRMIVEFSDKSEKSQSIKLKVRNILLSYGKNLNEAITNLLNDDQIEKTSKIETTKLKKNLESRRKFGFQVDTAHLKLAHRVGKVKPVEGKAPAAKAGTSTRI